MPRLPPSSTQAAIAIVLALAAACSSGTLPAGPGEVELDGEETLDGPPDADEEDEADGDEGDPPVDPPDGDDSGEPDEIDEPDDGSEQPLDDDGEPDDGPDPPPDDDEADRADLDPEPDAAPDTAVDAPNGTVLGGPLAAAALSGDGTRLYVGLPYDEARRKYTVHGAPFPVRDTLTLDGPSLGEVSWGPAEPPAPFVTAENVGPAGVIFAVDVFDLAPKLTMRSLDGGRLTIVDDQVVERRCVVPAPSGRFVWFGRFGDNERRTVAQFWRFDPAGGGKELVARDVAFDAIRFAGVGGSHIVYVTIDASGARTLRLDALDGSSVNVLSTTAIGADADVDAAAGRAWFIERDAGDAGRAQFVELDLLRNVRTVIDRGGVADERAPLTGLSAVVRLDADRLLVGMPITRRLRRWLMYDRRSRRTETLLEAACTDAVLSAGRELLVTASPRRRGDGTGEAWLVDLRDGASTRPPARLFTRRAYDTPRLVASGARVVFVADMATPGAPVPYLVLYAFAPETNEFLPLAQPLGGRVFDITRDGRWAVFDDPARKLRQVETPLRLR